ncbi:NAD(P)H-binding protein [Curtobacterium sp. MCLR17_042]|uniref:NAD(P)H-binding protein n=1 Tax=Curtobacterium sp. MCLR17_042 TaxID=2175626 RepID=UPI000DA78FA1|nr:NAD(P)H-binding protein [Curtobacterium sp. MCLR17_042]PZE29406.1 SDR family NAD(P)-dependent oxidoreductase [Curtobacterium sp. MCLR17_042]
MGEIVAVTGVTGDVGGKTAELLRAAGVTVRAVVRRPEQVDALRARGIDGRLADLGDEDALTAALEGVDRFFLVTPVSQRQREQGTTGVRAAQRAGIGRIVQLSGGDAAEHSPMSWASAAWHIDRRVRESGLAWTILHPSSFMTNVQPSAPAIRRGWFPHTTGRGVIGWIDTEDIARTAARVLTEDGHDSTEPVLTGPDLLDARGVATALATGLGRPVRALHLPSRVYAGVLRVSGVPAWQAEGLRQQFGRVVRRGLDGVDVMSDDVLRITGTAPRSLADWARAHRDDLLG